MPLDTGGIFVAVALPCVQFLPKQIYVPNPPGEALARHDIQLYLGDVQPAPMFGSVMDFQLFGDPVGFWSRKCLVQRGKGVGIQVVHHQYALSRSG